MQVEAAEPEHAAVDRSPNQGIAAMTAEPHLPHESFSLGPIQQCFALSFDGPVQVFIKVEAMNGPVVEALHPQSPKASQQLGLPVFQ